MAIVLNGKARKDWEKAGSIVLYFGMRIIATRLHLTDPKGKVVKLFIASAYAPVGAAPNEEREEYANHLQQCINACAKDEVLIIGTDANASPGVRKKHDDPFAPGRDKVRGPFGMVHENNAGQDLCSILGTNELCLATTFFRHKRYATWRHPCSKLWHQLDHCVVRQKDLERVLNARVMGLLGKDSDHMAISLKLRIGKGLKRKRTDKQIKARRIDRGLLKVPEVATQFRARVVQEMSTDRGQATELTAARSH